MSDGSASGARWLHPASRPAGDTIPVEALADIVAGLARIDRSVPDLRHVEWASPSLVSPSPASPSLVRQSPRSLRLLGTSAYDVWLITWPAGTGMANHDHGPSCSALQVVSGSLVESVPSAGGVPGWLRPLGQGCATMLEPGRSHELWNAAGGETTSVHAYSPPLDTVTYSDPVSVTRSSARPALLDLAPVDPELFDPAALATQGPGESSEVARPTWPRVRSFAGVAAEATSADSASRQDGGRMNHGVDGGAPG
jgi:Cysteine dioxygenase type I